MGVDRRVVRFAATIALGSLLLQSACGGKPVGSGTASRPPLASEVVTPVRTPLERIVDGTIEAVNQATVSAQTSGRVAEILYDVNDLVPAGAVIIRLKGTEQRAGLQGADAVFSEAKARAAEAATHYQRIAEMYQRHLVSRAQFEQAAADRDAAAARLTAAQAGLTTAREGVRYTEIRAPYAGVVTRRLVEVGEAVAPGTPLMTGLSLKDLRVETHVPQSIVARVRQLKQAAVYVDGQRLAAAHITIFPEAAVPSSTFRARLDLPSGTLDVAPGTYVKVGLVVGETDRLLVPAAALVERSELTCVYVLDPRGVSLRYIRPGHRYGDRVEVLAGIVAGERIALDPVAASATVAATGPAQ